MAEELLALLMDLMRLPGTTGAEGAIADRLKAAWTPLTDETGRTRVGAVYAVKHGAAKRPRPSVMFAAHMDAIGLVVAEVEGAWVRVASAGDFDARLLHGQRVFIHGRRLVPGIVVCPPPAFLPEDQREGRVRVSSHLIDTGLSPRALANSVRVGDAITFDRMPIQLGNGLIAGPSLDNRASLAALTLCLQDLRGKEHAWDVIAAATVQEEAGRVGALTAALSTRPALAIAIDVTYGRTQGLPEHLTFPLGGGLTNGWGPPIHPRVYELLRQAAEQAGIPAVMEPMPVESLTDAETLQLGGQGVPSGVLSIPIRYMHSPVEIVDLEDIRGAAEVLSSIVTLLDEMAPQDFFEE